MGILKNIDVPVMYDDCIALKYDTKGNVIKKGSTLTVRETQAAVFCDKGRAADVFGAGMYKLDTDSLPVLQNCWRGSTGLKRRSSPKSTL